MGITLKTENQDRERQEYTPSDEEKSELVYIFERFQKMKERRYAEEKEWKMDEEQYEMVIKAREEGDWRAKLKLPDTTAAILAFLAEVVDQNPGITYMPREVSDTERAEKYNSAFKYTWEKGKGNLELLDHLLQTGIYGTAFGKEYWCQERIKDKEVSEYEKDKDGNDTYVPKKWKDNFRIDFDDTKFKSVYIKNIWFDEAATSMDNAVDSVELEMYSPDVFHSNYDEVYPNAKKVIANAVYNYEWYTDEEGRDRIECLYYYNKAKDMFAIVANGILLTKAGNPNPYRHKQLPYVQSTCIPRIKNLFGMGFPRLVRSLQEEKDTIRNMRLDAAKLGVGAVVIIDDRVELDDEDLEIRPHMVIRAPIDGVNIVKAPDLNTATYKEEELLKEDIIRVTGVDPRLQTLGGKGDTATEIAILKESSMKRIRLILRLVEWQGLYRIGRLRLANFMQFYKMPKYRDIIGENGEIEKEEYYPTVMDTKGGQYESVEFKDDDFKGEYDTVVVPGSTLPISKALEAQKRINLFDRLKGHPDVNQRKLAEELIKAHDMPAGELMTKEGEPPMGQAQVGAMPGQGTGLQASPEMQMADVSPEKQFGPQNMNQ